jgi:hypothetical protein
MLAIVLQLIILLTFYSLSEVIHCNEEKTGHKTTKNIDSKVTIKANENSLKIVIKFIIKNQQQKYRCC